MTAPKRTRVRILPVCRKLCKLSTSCRATFCCCLCLLYSSSSSRTPCVKIGFAALLPLKSPKLRSKELFFVYKELSFCCWRNKTFLSQTSRWFFFFFFLWFSGTDFSDFCICCICEGVVASLYPFVALPFFSPVGWDDTHGFSPLVVVFGPLLLPPTQSLQRASKLNGCKTFVSSEWVLVLFELLDLNLVMS